MNFICHTIKFHNFNCYRTTIGYTLTRRLSRAIEFLDRKELWGKDNNKPRIVAASGGVACNHRIRSMIEYTCQLSNCHAVFPPPKYCTDNGVMIAWNGVENGKEILIKFHQTKFSMWMYILEFHLDKTLFKM